MYFLDILKPLEFGGRHAGFPRILQDLIRAFLGVANHMKARAGYSLKALVVVALLAVGLLVAGLAASGFSGCGGKREEDQLVSRFWSYCFDNSAQDAANFWKQTREELGSRFGDLPFTERGGPYGTLASKFFSEGDYSQALDMALLARTEWNESPDGYEVYLAGLAGRTEWLKDYADHNEGLDKLFAEANLAWTAGDYAGVRLLTAQELSIHEPGSPSQEVMRFWLTCLDAKALAQQGDHAAAFRQFDKRVCPDLRLIERYKDVIVDVGLLAAREAESCGEYDAANEYLLVAERYFTNFYDKSREAKIKEVHEMALRVRAKMATQEKSPRISV
jgi:hypothetical protein